MDKWCFRQGLKDKEDEPCPGEKHHVQKPQTWSTLAPSGADREPRGSWRERVGAAEGKAEGLVEATVCVFSTSARDPTFYSEDSSGV